MTHISLLILFAFCFVAFGYVSQDNACMALGFGLALGGFAA